MAASGELTRQDRDLASLAVLALLSTGPRHPYDIHRMLTTTGKRFVTGLPRSLYHAVERLSRHGLITAAGTERESGRPERTVYRLTDAGRDEARRRVEILLCTPTADADLTCASLSFVSVLPKERAVAALRMRTGALGEAAAALEDALAGAADVPPLLLVESEFELARLRAERAFTTEVAERIGSGDLAWLEASVV